ncbi:hypothetical protein [Pseudonocardia parietis]|uniref:Helix-turn-helix protein n=1 Tax=Pseudonocardia parietis TaxID=570936 RepID=A0ABS4W263_9PSEU|nr:hypothetical protein [Pseudonocardia parietis]MBP2370292.1 hypothetical protein [Pseudonocardia parietis]
MSTSEHQGPETRPRWWPWLSEQMTQQWGRVNRKRLAETAGFNRSITYDWEKGAVPNPGIVVAVADALKVNRVEALVAADLLNADEFRTYFSTGAERDLSDEALAAEVLRRMKSAGRGGTPDPEPDASDLDSYEQAPRHRTGEPVDTGRVRRRHDESSTSPGGQGSAD